MKTLLSAATVALALLAVGCPQNDAPTQKAVPNPAAGGIAGFTGSANKAKLKVGLMAVLNAAKTYKATEAKVPEDVQVLVAADLLTADQATDLWGNDYVLDTESPSIVVLTYGADGAPGGDGANTDWSSDDLK